MKCVVCGSDSGNYRFCRECYKRREAGEIIKCPQCLKWHYVGSPCVTDSQAYKEVFLYKLKPSLVTKNERDYLNCIRDVLPTGCQVQPQMNLASFIQRTDNARFQNELYRNVDFLIVDSSYRPLVVIEINDQTHRTKERHERDKKVTNICEEAGIPIIKLWTEYGINQQYIKRRIEESVSSLPAKRIQHFSKREEVASDTLPIPTERIDTSSDCDAEKRSKKKEGCYIATCVYGSYDCPQVWALRRFRDEHLRKTGFGCAFVSLYYRISPCFVQRFGNSKIFRSCSKKFLDILVMRLIRNGIYSIPYADVEDD